MKHILLLHGALGSARQLEPLRVSLLQEGFQVSSLNFSGHSGEPFREDFGIAVFADDVLQFMDRNNISEASIFGYSMGGYVALWFALNHPDRVERIVTLGTKFDWNVESAEKEVKKLNAEKIVGKVPAFARILEQRHHPNDWKLLLKKTGEMMLGLGNNPMLTDVHFRKISHPIKIMLGDTDDMADRAYSRHVSSALPHGEFTLLENTPHPIEKVDLGRLTREVRGFLERGG